MIDKAIKNIETRKHPSPSEIIADVFKTSNRVDYDLVTWIIRLYMKISSLILGIAVL